jgi:flagellar basal-body rod protein FlgB
MDASGISFGQTVDLLSNAIEGSSREQTQIANNLANVNTPNFRRSTTSFRDALAASIGQAAPPDELPLVTDNDRQIQPDGSTAPVAFDPQGHVDETTQMRVDRSNVDVDQELGQLSENEGYSTTMSGLLSKQYGWLREAITEQPT